ncbi:MAG: RagB/SusD family nutrient uptake outer membrane protein [Gemmatimonadetes bacterium]|nr:RagB/SusD family nutrient uptake outer membrane protein [Gemmatimonadota bacterium]
MTYRINRRVWLAGIVLVAGAPVAACDTLLEIDAPSRVRADDLANPDNAPLLVASAVADFECAFSEWVAAGGLMGNELVDGQLAARMWPYDRRSFEEAGGVYANFTCADADPGVYTTLSTARWAADNALGVSQEIGDAELMATSAAYSGYAHLLLGEAMCTAAVDGGPELTSQQMFAMAEEKFTMAANGGGPADITNMAMVGRARARLNQGNTSGAASDAAQVPAGFVRNAHFSAASFRSSNRIWTLNNRDERMSVERVFWNLEYMGTPDPRVSLVDQGRTAAADDLTPLWTQKKYPAQDSPMPIARYAEAQLIMAEAAGGQAAVDIINELHAAAGLPAFPGGSDAEIREQLIQERNRELFLEGHHFYDKIRLNLPFTPPAGEVFQEGSGPKGGFYGNTTCLPLPLLEKNNNPNIS